MISVIIPCYNMAKYIDQAINSVLDCTFEDIEVVVIDDGSTDRTKRVVGKYLDASGVNYDSRVCYYYQQNKGKSVAVNRGLTVSKGDYIAILDADDQFTHHSLRSRYEAIDEKKSAIAVGGFEVFKGDETLGQRAAPSLTSVKKLRRRFYLSYKTPFSLNNCLIPRPLIEETGWFDPEMKRCQDIDYAIRLLNNVESVEPVDSIVYRYRKHRSTVESRVKLRLKTLLYRSKVIRRNFHGPIGVFIAIYAALLDLSKVLYEILGAYKN
jgi:glycosyltransferase involved in cell wall biosynthesis